MAINISSTRLEFCSSGSPSPLSFAYPQTAVSEMEVINREELKSRLSAFFSEHQIHAEPLVLVLGESMYYSKDYLTSTPPIQEDIQKYLDLVPFSSVSYRVYRLPVGHRLVVINRDFYEDLKNILLSLGFSILSVVPSFIITGPGTTTAFSAQTCLLINKKMNLIMENSFGGQEMSQNPAANTHRYIENHKIVFAILAVVIILACPVIIYLYYQNQKAALNAQKTTTQKPAVTVVKPTLTPTPTLSPSAELLLNQYSLQILNGSGVSGLAASLEATFRQAGFTQVTTGNYPNTAKTTLVVNSGLPESVSDFVIETLTPLFKNISIKQSSQSQFDLVLTTGKITP